MIQQNTTPITWYANLSNGLAYPHDGVCAFLSTFGHHYRNGYFRIDSMPYDAVILLLQGQRIGIVDATQHDKPLTDALKFGVPTWCRVFNRAIRCNDVQVCQWETVHIKRAAGQQGKGPLVQTIRKLAILYGVAEPAIIGENVLLDCHRSVQFDDKPGALKETISTNSHPPK